MKKTLINFVIALWLIVSLPAICASVYNLNNPDKQLPKIGLVYKAIATSSTSEPVGVCSQKGTENFIYFGTYRPMMGGKYNANFEVQGNGKIFFDVVSSQGTKLQDSRELTIDNDQKNLSVDFNIKYYQDDVELRLRHLDNSGICIESVATNRKTISWIGNIRGLLSLIKAIV